MPRDPVEVRREIGSRDIDVSGALWLAMAPRGAWFLGWLDSPRQHGGEHARCGLHATLPPSTRQPPHHPANPTHATSPPTQMTGGVGDYYIPEEDQPVGVRVARSFGARVAAWYSQQDGKQVL